MLSLYLSRAAKVVLLHLLLHRTSCHAVCLHGSCQQLHTSTTLHTRAHFVVHLCKGLYRKTRKKENRRKNKSHIKEQREANAWDGQAFTMP